MTKLLSSKEVAEMLGVTDQTLRIWRMKGNSPKYVRFGKLKSRCGYREEDVLKWIEERLTNNTTEEAEMLR
jgi:predicted DNA-binding transcriptional regulator AlpA